MLRRSSSSSSSEEVGDGDTYSGEIDGGNNYRRALVILKRVLAKAVKSPGDSTAELMTPFRLVDTCVLMVLPYTLAGWADVSMFGRSDNLLLTCCPSSARQEKDLLLQRRHVAQLRLQGASQVGWRRQLLEQRFYAGPAPEASIRFFSGSGCCDSGDSFAISRRMPSKHQQTATQKWKKKVFFSLLLLHILHLFHRPETFQPVNAARTQ